MSVAVAAIVSTTALFVYSLVVYFEERRGSRLMLSNSRAFLDKKMVQLWKTICHTSDYILHRVITLSWYYSLHTILKLSLKAIAGIYFAVEQILINNRNKARQLRRLSTTSHLSAISQHQKETTLSEKEKRKLRDKALKG
jgi:hypothetical protein